MLTFVVQSHRGVEQLVARRAHNPEAGGSSPSPATRIRMLRNQCPYFLILLPEIVNWFVISEKSRIFAMHYLGSV